MLFGDFLLPLLGGFVFIRFCYRTRYPTSRLPGQRLIIWSAVVGIFLASVSWVVIFLLSNYLFQVGELEIVFEPFLFSGTACVAFLLGCVLWHPANLLDSEEKAHKWTLVRYGSLVEILFAKTFENDKQVQVTLTDGKVFVGYILKQPLDPNKDDPHVGILPTLSGYRDAKTKEVKFTTDYIPTYEALEKDDLDPDDFIKYIPMSEIRLASVFDHDVYKNWVR